MDLYKIPFEDLSSFRLSEINAENSVSFLPIDDGCTFEEFMQLFSNITSPDYKINEDTKGENNQINIIKYTCPFIQYLMLDNPDIDNLFMQIDNDQYLLLLFANIPNNEAKFQVLFLYELLFCKRFIKDPSKFNNIFLKYYFECTNTEDEYSFRCFHQTLFNLLLNFSSGIEIFDEAFYNHLSKVSHINFNIDKCILNFIQTYCKIIHLFNENSFSKFDFIDENFYDFMEEFTKTINLDHKELANIAAKSFLRISENSFFNWLYQEDYFLEFVAEIIHRSIDDNDLFITILLFYRLTNNIVLLIKDLILNVIIIKCKKLSEIPEWSDIENKVARKIIKSFHFLFNKLGNQQCFPSFEHKISMMTFLLHLYEKSIYSIKLKAIDFVSILLDNFTDPKINNDAINLAALLFSRSCELFFDNDSSVFLLLAGYQSFLSKMIKMANFNVKNIFIQNDAINILNKIMENQSIDSTSYEVTNEILSILTTES